MASNNEKKCYEHWIVLDDNETALRYAVALRSLIDYLCTYSTVYDYDFEMPNRIQIILSGSTITVRTDIPWNDEVDKLASIITNAECEFRKDN